VGDGLVDHDFGCKVDVRRSGNFGQCVLRARLRLSLPSTRDRDGSLSE
jgi:hypothetical protein